MLCNEYIQIKKQNITCSANLSLMLEGIFKVNLMYHGIRSHHFMQIDGETMETVTDFIFLGSKITADGDCSHEIKRHLPLEEKLWPTLTAY